MIYIQGYLSQHFSNYCGKMLEATQLSISREMAVSVKVHINLNIMQVLKRMI